MAYLPPPQCEVALSPALQRRIVAASTAIAGATLLVSLGLFAWTLLKAS
jgi:hypothetical protein